MAGPLGPAAQAERWKPGSGLHLPCQPWAPESAENPGLGEEAAAQSQKLLRERWQQDAIVRPQSRYFRGNQKHQLGK